MEGFKHDDDWERHPYGCDCDKCYEKFLLNAIRMCEIIKEASNAH